MNVSILAAGEAASVLSATEGIGPEIALAAGGAVLLGASVLAFQRVWGTFKKMSK